MNKHINKNKLPEQIPIATIFKQGNNYSIVSKLPTNHIINIMFNLINILIRNDEKQRLMNESKSKIINPLTGKLIVLDNKN